jgi:kumamolisin
MAMSPGSPTTYWHYTEGIARFIRDLAGKPRPSLVASISYALSERFMTAGEYRIFEEWILKASAMGVTVFVASGDQGANGGGTDGTMSSCRYDPSYPNSNPYVVSVGATNVRRTQEHAVYVISLTSN